MVLAALWDFGRRKAGTPLEMASTPVRATAPDEKPFRRMNSPRVPPVAAARGGEDRLEVGRDDDRQEEGDDDGDRDQVVDAKRQGRRSDGGDEQDLLSGVRRRGDGVRRERRQGDQLGEELVLLLLGGDRAAHQEPLHYGVHGALTIGRERFSPASRILLVR